VNVLLSMVVWTPMIGALLILLVPRDNPDGVRRAAFAFSLITFLLSLSLWLGFRPDTADFQYKCTTFYDAEDEIAIRWDDPEIGIDWPLPDPTLSDRDRAAMSLRESLERLRSAGT